MVSQINKKLKEQQNRIFGFETYSNYFAAWRISFELAAGKKRPDPNDVTKMIQFGNLQVKQLSTDLESRVCQAFNRGVLSLKAMDIFQNAAFHQLPSIAMWNAVQAYYAVHGAALATLGVVKREHPVDHKKFRNSISDLISVRFPSPLNLNCNPDPAKARDCVFSDNSINETIVKGHSNLLPPSISDAQIMMAKSLHKTRDGLQEIESGKQKIIKKLERRSPKDVKQAYLSLDDIGIVDLFWWMRIESNYQDPMLFEEPLPSGETTKFCTELFEVTRMLMVFLRATIDGCASKKVIQNLQVIP